jgi:hypothetical protein
VGHRAGHVPGGTERPEVSIPPAHDVERATSPATRNATIELDGCGQGWQGKETTLRLHGWSRQRRIILLRRKKPADQPATHRTEPAQLLLGFGVNEADKELWEYAALVTSLPHEILTLGQLYRDRADAENVFDELKNQWGWVVSRRRTSHVAGCSPVSLH